MRESVQSGAAGRSRSMTPLSVAAAQGRRLILDLQGLADPPHRRFGDGGLLALIGRMGFVQVDSIRTVERAHHTILHSRNRTYRTTMLDGLLERERSLFEHWTHDASVIPTAFYPVWRRKFRREAAVLRERYRRWHGPDFEAETGPLLDTIAENGPVRARDLERKPARNPRGWWDWHAGKTALEFLWRTGELAVARRENFQKVYDLSRRVLPPEAFEDEPDEPAFIDWACRSALDRLGFGTAPSHSTPEGLRRTLGSRPRVTAWLMTACRSSSSSAMSFCLALT